MEWLKDIVEKLEAEGYYGTLSLRFRNGVIELIEYNHTEKPPVNGSTVKETGNVVRVV